MKNVTGRFIRRGKLSWLFIISLMTTSCQEDVSPPKKVEIPLTFSSFDPPQGIAGDDIQLRGTGFNPHNDIYADEANIEVTVNGKTAVITNYSLRDTSIIVKVPAKCGNGPISITVNGNTISHPTQFQYLKSWRVTTIAQDLDQVSGIALDHEGNMFISEHVASRILKVTKDGIVTLFAGPTYEAGFPGLPDRGFQDGPGRQARFRRPSGIAINEAGVLYVADQENNAIRKITPDGVVTTVAGNGDAGFLNGQGTEARFHWPEGITTDKQGNIYVSDQGNHCIRKITSDGLVSTYAGMGIAGFENGNALSAQFYFPGSLTCDADGNIYVADQLNYRIRKITPQGEVTTFSGSGTGGFRNGPSEIAEFGINSVLVSNGSKIYVGDNSSLREISSDGTVSGIPININDRGYTSLYGFNKLSGIALTSDGTLLLTDYRALRYARVE